MNKIKIYLSLAFLLFPLTSQAQLIQTMALTGNALGIINGTLIPLAFSLALLYFFYGLAKYIRSEGQGKEEGRMIMVWGVVALFVMSSVWGLVYFIRREFRITDDTSIPLPRISP